MKLFIAGLAMGLWLGVVGIVFSSDDGNYTCSMQNGANSSFSLNCVVLSAPTATATSPPATVTPAPVVWLGRTDADTYYPEPNTSKPAYLTTVTEPTFGTKLTRVTGNPGSAIPTVGGTWGNTHRHDYFKVQPWNTNQSLLKIGSLFLDGSTYQVLFQRALAGETRWHASNPDLMIQTMGNTLKSVNVRTGATTTLNAFTLYSTVQMGPSEGNLSNDGRWLALYANRASDGVKVTVVYDTINNVVVAEKALGDYYAPDDGFVTVSALGNFVYAHFNDNDIRVYDRDLNQLRVVTDLTHYDHGVDAAGREILVGTSPSNGWLVKVDLATGTRTNLTTKGYGHFNSMRSILLPGWVYRDHWGRHLATNYRPWVDEMDSFNVDAPGTMRRFAHLHANNDGLGWQAQPDSVPSPDGRRVLFASRWDSNNGPIQSYVVDTRP